MSTGDGPFRNLLESLRPFYGVLSTESPEFIFPLPCEFCRRRFNTVADLELHMQYHRRENECSICGKTFASFDIFSAHVRKHYVDATKDFSVANMILEEGVRCRFCNEEFLTLRHQQIHTALFSDVYVRCGECGGYLPACHRHCDTSLSTSQLLREHHLEQLRRETFHRVSEEGKEKGKIHSSLSTFRHHTKRDLLCIRPYQCELCKSRFEGSEGLLEHLNSHYTEHTLLYDHQPGQPFTGRVRLIGPGGKTNNAYQLTL